MSHDPPCCLLQGLLRVGPALSDLESLDAEFHSSLQWTKDNDITDLGLDLVGSSGGSGNGNVNLYSAINLLMCSKALYSMYTLKFRSNMI